MDGILILLLLLLLLLLCLYVTYLKLYTCKDVSRMYNVADILWVQHVEHVMLFNFLYCIIIFIIKSFSLYFL